MSLLPTGWAAAPIGLPATPSLAQAAAQAAQRQQPLVVMVSLPGCPFCKTVRESHLAPLLREQKLPVVQIDWRSAQSVADFLGQPSTHEAMSRLWGIKVAPTVLFFGPGGQELAPRLVGAGLADFYGAYLDQRLADARTALR